MFKMLVNREKFSGDYMGDETHYLDGSVRRTIQDELHCSDGFVYKVFPSREAAGEAAREEMEEQILSDPKEAVHLLGSNVLIAWALGEYAGPGYEKVRSLKEWLHLYLTHPEEHFASWDGSEVDIVILHEDGSSVELVGYRVDNRSAITDGMDEEDDVEDAVIA